MILTIDDDFYIDGGGYVVVCDTAHQIRLQLATDEDIEVYKAKCEIEDAAKEPVAKRHILNVVCDLALNFMVYDRKDDDELSRDELSEAIRIGIVTIDEIMYTFRDELLASQVRQSVFGTYRD